MDEFSIEIMVVGVSLLMVILTIGILLEKHLQKKIDEEMQDEIRTNLYK